MSRFQYLADRAWTRQHRADRVAQGLPHHPDGTGWATCPECKGECEFIRNDSPDGDPQCEYPVPCHLCGGDGEVADGHEDPLLTMRRHRRQMRTAWRASPGFASVMYRLDRERAMRRVKLPRPAPAAVHPLFDSLIQPYRRAA